MVSIDFKLFRTRNPVKYTPPNKPFYLGDFPENDLDMFNILVNTSGKNSILSSPLSILDKYINNHPDAIPNMLKMLGLNQFTGKYYEAMNLLFIASLTYKEKWSKARASEITLISREDVMKKIPTGLSYIDAISLYVTGIIPTTIISKNIRHEFFKYGASKIMILLEAGVLSYKPRENSRSFSEVFNLYDITARIYSANGPNKRSEPYLLGLVTEPERVIKALKLVPKGVEENYVYDVLAFGNYPDMIDPYYRGRSFNTNNYTDKEIIAELKHRKMKITDYTWRDGLVSSIDI